MTVRELLKELRKWPLDAEVRYGLGDYAPRTVYGVAEEGGELVVKLKPDMDLDYVRVAP